MKLAILFAYVLACYSSLGAQITASLTRLPNDTTAITVRNDAAVDLTAFALVLTYVDRSGGEKTPFLIYVDPVTDATAQPLPPHQERVVVPEGVVLGGARIGRYGYPLFEQQITSAGILADGTPVGDAALFTRMILRRSNLLLAVETTRDMLFDAGRHNVPRDKLIGQFKSMAQSVDHWYLLPEQQVGRTLYQSMVQKLMSLPEGRLGTAFPPSTFVAQETAVLNRQRVTLAESQPRLGAQ